MSGGTKVQTTESKPWAEQIPYLTEGFEQAKDIYNQGVPDYYPDATVAGFDPAQKAAQQATLGYAMGPRTAAMQMGAEGALGRSLGGYTGFNPNQTADLLSGKVDLGPRSPFASTANALQQQVMGNLKGNILPGLRQQTTTYQPGGGSRGNLVQNKAIASAVQQGLTKPLADMYAGAYQTAQGMRMPAAGMGIQQQQYGQSMYPSIMGAPMAMYGAMGDVGAQRQAMRQQQMGADMARYQYGAAAPEQALANYMNTISGNYGGTVTKTTPGQSPLGSIASLASAFMGPSDMRIKENIVSDGTTYNGHNVYHFNFIGDDVRRRGVMAQEVEQTRPDAVVEIGGIKHVDYGAL
jgi:hypothetical protein